MASRLAKPKKKGRPKRNVRVEHPEPSAPTPAQASKPRKAARIVVGLAAGAAFWLMMRSTGASFLGLTLLAVAFYLLASAFGTD
jgi:hypothetical protein